MKKFLAVVLAVALGLFCLPVAAEEQVSFDYDNSVFVTAFSENPKSFDGSDFPEIENCTVYTVSKAPTDGGYQYKLILKDNGGTKVNRKLIASLKSNSFVKDADFNSLYTYREDFIELNSNKLYLKVGESAELNIVKAEIVRNHIQNFGLLFSVDTEKFDRGFKTSDFRALGGDKLCPGEDWGVLNSDPEPLEGDEICENGKYFGTLKSNKIEDLIAMADKLAKTDGFLAVSVARIELPYAQPSEECWTASPYGIVSIALSGGVPADIGNKGYTAAVTAEGQGIATVTAVRREVNGEASSDCTVIVYKPMDVSGDDRIDVNDALLALQKTVDKIDLDERAFVAADADKTGQITVSDALTILQAAVGV